MFTIDLIVKYTPVPLSVQRKTAEDAETVYQQVLEAIRSPESRLVELTCEKQPEKKVAVLSSDISAVVISQKSGAAAAGKSPGFVSFVAAE